MARRLPVVSLSLALIVLLVQYTSFGAPSSAGGAAYGQMKSAMGVMQQKMAGMKSSDNPDMDFAMMMIPHHQAAIDMARAELEHGKDPQIRKMAQAIITAQQKEISQLKAWMEKHGQGMKH